MGHCLAKDKLMKKRDKCLKYYWDIFFHDMLMKYCLKLQTCILQSVIKLTESIQSWRLPFTPRHINYYLSIYFGRALKLDAVYNCYTKYP